MEKLSELAGREKVEEESSAPSERTPYSKDKIDINNRLFSLESRVGILEQQAAEVEHKSMMRNLVNLGYLEDENPEDGRERRGLERDPKRVRGEYVRKGIDLEMEKEMDEMKDWRGRDKELYADEKKK